MFLFWEIESTKVIKKCGQVQTKIITLQVGNKNSSTHILNDVAGIEEVSEPDFSRGIVLGVSILPKKIWILEH